MYNIPKTGIAPPACLEEKEKYDLQNLFVTLAGILGLGLVQLGSSFCFGAPVLLSRSLPVSSEERHKGMLNIPLGRSFAEQPLRADKRQAVSVAVAAAPAVALCLFLPPSSLG